MQKVTMIIRLILVCSLSTGLVLMGCGEDNGAENSTTENGDGDGDGGDGDGGDGDGGDGDGGDPDGDGDGDGPETCTEEYEYSGGSITSDQQLIAACSPYEIESDIRVNEDATLTIDAGVTLQFRQDVDMRIGQNSEGRLIAVGTDTAPIIMESFLGEHAEAGSWAGIAFRDGTLPGTEMEHVIIRDGGGDANRHSGCVTATELVAGRLSIDNVEFENCEIAGIDIGRNLGSFSNNTFRDMTVGIAAHTRALGTIDGGQTFENVDRNRFYGETVNEDVVIQEQSIPWQGSSDIRVGGDESPVLTMEAGVHIQFDDGQGMRVGHNNPGQLIIAGESGNEVLIEGRIEESASWSGIAFRPETLNGSSIDHAVIRNGGQDENRHEGCVTVVSDRDDRVSITNTEFEGCDRAAVYSNSWFQSFENNTFTDGTVGIDVHAGVVGSISANQTYHNVDRNQTHGQDIDRDSTWPAADIPWRITTQIYVRGDSDPVLTIGEGVELQFDGGTGMRVGHNERGGLQATGTLFTSSEPNPLPGSWPGIVFRADTLNDSFLDGVEISYAGESSSRYDGGVTVTGDAGPRVEIVDSTFHENDQVDIAFSCSAPPTMSGNERSDGSDIETTNCS